MSEKRIQPKAPETATLAAGAREATEADRLGLRKSSRAGLRKSSRAGLRKSSRAGLRRTGRGGMA